MENIIIIIAIAAAIIAAAIIYIIRAKKGGAHCIGCPHSKQCGGNCCSNKKKSD